MAILWKGTGNVTLVRSEVIKDPNLGVTVEQEYHGPEAAITGLELSYRNNRNASTRRGTAQPPVRSLIVRFGSESPSDQPVDTWRVSWETLDKDMFLCSNAIAESTATGNPATYRKQVEEAVSKGDAASTLSGTIQRQLYLEISRGATHFRDRYLTLRCRRLVSASSTAVYTVSSQPGPIYSTAQLPVPAGIFAKLPGTSGNAFPGNPAQAQWGWLNVGFDTDYIGNKAEISLEFVLSAWSTLVYATATGNFVF
jgi:hypothetical protein